MENSRVLFYKPQDTTCKDHSGLKNQDFILAIMNSGHKDIAMKFGADCICLDSTHGLNGYGFEMTTLLVIDDMRQGFPCAFLISNRMDSEILEIFFNLIRKEVGTMSPSIFMSDLAENFYNAWVTVMGPPSNRLWCTWHVDHAWRNNLSKIKTQAKRCEAYKMLKKLHTEKNEDQFKTLYPVLFSQRAFICKTLELQFLKLMHHYLIELENFVLNGECKSCVIWELGSMCKFLLKSANSSSSFV